MCRALARTTLGLAAVVVALFVTLPAAAQLPKGAMQPVHPGGLSPLPPPPPVQAVRITTPIDVDGDLSEAVWKEAPAYTEFHAKDPVEWAPPSQRTEVRVAYDDDALYVGARM